MPESLARECLAIARDPLLALRAGMVDSSIDIFPLPRYLPTRYCGG